MRCVFALLIALLFSAPAWAGTPVPSVTVADLQTDEDGALIAIVGTAAKLRYWDDFTAGRPELTDYLAGATAYRLKKLWTPSTTFVCVQPQRADGSWSDGYRCNGVSTLTKSSGKHTGRKTITVTCEKEEEE